MSEPEKPTPRTFYDLLHAHGSAFILMVGMVLAAVVGAVGAWIAKQPAAAPPAVPYAVGGAVDIRADGTLVPPPEKFGQGWVNDPDEVKAVAATLPVKVFGDTPAGSLPETDLPDEIYGWKYYEKLFARPPPIKDQGALGSCVSFGTNTAVETTEAAEIVLRNGHKEEWARFAEEATYGGSRVEIGGGRLGGDGSVGVWAAQWAVKFGMVPRQKYPEDDLSVYSVSRCRLWGDRGVPAAFEAVARKYPVKSYTQVKNWADVKKACAQGYFVAICSNQGFSAERDANGVARPQGSWAHCMALTGYHKNVDGREYGHIQNSWGTGFHHGPVGWGDPNPDGFWADAAVIDRMVKQGDSWAFSGVTGFPRRKLPIPWVVKQQLVGPPVLVAAN